MEEGGAMNKRALCEEHPAGDPAVNTAGLPGTSASSEPENSEPENSPKKRRISSISENSEPENSEGCVLQCLNRLLRFHDREEVSAASLQSFLAPILESAGRNGTLGSVFGTDNILGSLHEDEAVVGQVRLLLKDLCGTGQFTYRRINPAAILSSSNSMLVQCCMERISQDSQTIPREHLDTQDGEEYLQLVTITDTAEIHQDRDKGTYSPSPSSAAYAASAAASVVSCF